MQERDLNEQRDCGEREEPEVQMQRDDREWEGGVWVAQNQVHFSQHLPLQHSTSHKQVCKYSQCHTYNWSANRDCGSFAAGPSYVVTALIKFADGPADVNSFV